MTCATHDSRQQTNRSPRVSIIVPVYNGREYIERCVASILQQTYSNFELILVDDGSTDDSPKLIKLLAAKDSRIKCVLQANGGPSSARNAGLGHAVGEYIMFVDGDDEVEPTIIHSLLQPFSSPGTHVDLVVCGYVWSEGAIRICLNHYLLGHDTKLSQISLVRCALSGIGGSLAGKLFRARLIREANLRFDNSLRMCEDLLFVVEYALHCRCGIGIDEYLYFYHHDNRNSICANLGDNVFEIHGIISDKLLRILLKGGFNAQAARNLTAARRVTQAIDVALRQTSRLLIDGPRACARQLHLMMSDPRLKRDLALINKAGIKTRTMAMGMQSGCSWVFLGLCVLRLLAQRLKHAVLGLKKTKIRI
jgi:glycosyltransferase involved in cell wall biosynthesis